MRLLSLDISTKNTGYAIFENDKLIESGVLVSDDKYLENRLIEMKYNIIKLCKESDISMMVTEQEQQHINSTVTIALSKLQGVFRCLSDDLKIPYLFVPINKWRIDVGIKHNLKREILKQLAIEKVKELYGLETTSDDEAESILIGRWFLNNRKNIEGWE